MIRPRHRRRRSFSPQQRHEYVGDLRDAFRCTRSLKLLATMESADVALLATWDIADVLALRPHLTPEAADAFLRRNVPILQYMTEEFEREALRDCVNSDEGLERE